MENDLYSPVACPRVLKSIACTNRSVIDALPKRLSTRIMIPPSSRRMSRAAVMNASAMPASTSMRGVWGGKKYGAKTKARYSGP